ncbi:uncharacterized protein LOC132738124 [Ruditapes philippinarum]|uniref:uncharacterized protein LOC132738124 n=1 Tax=Ruditapes philippinarum TaxID=129788 RepID=UPI00295AC038|nr:uncharacterized protein LOC132738124 [Ruditapes philippinarum]
MEDKDLNNRLYKTLVDVVGTEDDIRCRQDMFTYMGVVNGFGDKDSVSIPGGSLSEGFDLKGSDEDIMLVLKNIDVVPADQDVMIDKNTVRVNMQVDKQRAGYASLDLSVDQERYVNDVDNLNRTEVLNIKRSLQKSNKKCIVASARFRGQFIRPGNTSHGPCISDGLFDFAISLYGTVWPSEATKRLSTSKSKRWLTKTFVNELISEGCIYVPVGPRHYYSGTLWRISFAKAERRLILSMRHVQWLCYGLPKIVFKEGIGKALTENDILCSYFLKTCLFWLVEETDNDENVWNQGNIFNCYMMCLDRLIKWVEMMNCPNFIIPENNMFRGKVNDENKSDILKVLLQMKTSGYKGLLTCESLRQYMETSAIITPFDREAKLDLLCFRVLHIYPFDDKDLLQEALERMEKEYEKQEKKFTKGIIGNIVSSLHQELAQMIHVSESYEDGQKLKRLQKHHLLKGCKSDRLCGLILLASFYCTEKKYYTALEILNTVTRKLTPEAGLLLRRNPVYTQAEIQEYKERFCGKGLCLEEKFDMATVRKVVLLDNSSIVPDEFQPEVFNYRPLNMMSPTIYAYALMFVCYHHINEESKALEMLAHLEQIIKTRFLISSVGATYSTDCTVVGACFETQGHYETAMKYYNKALNCEQICRSTAYRFRRLEKRFAVSSVEK